MKLPSRRSRPRGRARLALAGDFPDADRDITEAMEAIPPAPWHGTTIPLSALRDQPRYQPAAGPQPPPVTGRVLDTLNYLRLKVAILEAGGDADRIDASEQGRRDGQQLLSWSPLRQIRDDAVTLLRRGTS